MSKENKKDNERRVGVILGADEKNKIVRFLGYGKYIGDYIPKEAIGFLAEGLRLHEIPNPKILLDNGAVVYGCESWWGSEDSVKQNIEKYKEKGYEIVLEDINKVRKEFIEESMKTKIIKITDNVNHIIVDEVYEIQSNNIFIGRIYIHEDEIRFISKYIKSVNRKGFSKLPKFRIKMNIRFYSQDKLNHKDISLEFNKNEIYFEIINRNKRIWITRPNESDNMKDRDYYIEKNKIEIIEN